MNINALNALGEAEVKRLLLEEGRRLEKIAKQIWQKYLDSYEPVEYIRTGKSMQSIQLGQVERLSPLEYGIRLNFVDDLAYHDSVFKGGKQGHAIMLISSGWKVKKGWHKNIYRFGYYEGFNVIEKIISEFEKSKPPNIQVQFDWNGAYTR